MRPDGDPAAIAVDPGSNPPRLRLDRRCGGQDPLGGGDHAGRVVLFGLLAEDLVEEADGPSVKIPRDPQVLGLANPYPSLETSWRLGEKEWGWHVPSADAVPDVGVALDIAAPFHPMSGPWVRTTTP